MFGKAIFYFGFVFFSLNLISSSLQPLQNNPALIELLTNPQNPMLAILFGCVFTAVVQSSSVTTGLAIIFTQQGLLGLENAVPLIMGANIGTTATALIAVFGMDIAAKKTALSHFLFNIGGVLIFVPILFLYGDRLNTLDTDPALALANIHLIFNVLTSVVFIAMVGPFSRLVDRLMGTGEMDFERLPLPTRHENTDYQQVSEELDSGVKQILPFLQENYNLVALSVETNYKGIFEAAGKRIEYLEFLRREYRKHFSHIALTVSDESESRKLMAAINRYDYIFQIQDSIVDLFETKKIVRDNYVDLNSDILILIRELSGSTLELFDAVNTHLADFNTDTTQSAAQALQGRIDKVNRALLRMLADPNRRDASALANFVTYTQRLKDKLVNLSRLTPPPEERDQSRANHDATDQPDAGMAPD